MITYILDLKCLECSNDLPLSVMVFSPPIICASCGEDITHLYKTKRGAQKGKAMNQDINSIVTHCLICNAVQVGLKPCRNGHTHFEQIQFADDQKKTVVSIKPLLVIKACNRVAGIGDGEHRYMTPKEWVRQIMMGINETHYRNTDQQSREREDKRFQRSVQKD